MNPIDKLKEEHDLIERELLEFDEIINSDVINYPNLLHVFKKFCGMWDTHEEKEEAVFRIMRNEGLVVPVYKMRCDHKDLRMHLENLKKAFLSGSDAKIKMSLKKDLKSLVEKVRKHKNYEDEILYTIFAGQISKKNLERINKVMSKFG